MGGGGRCPFTAKYKLKKKIQIKVVYDCAEITKRSSNAIIKMGKKVDERLKGGGQTGQWLIQGRRLASPYF